MSDLYCPTEQKTINSDYSNDLGELNNLLRCQGICGPNHYIDLDTSVNPPTSECRSCGSTEGDVPDEYRNQCSNYNSSQLTSTNWFQEQKSMNVGRDSETVMRKNWQVSSEFTSTQCSSGDELSNEDLIRCEILSYYNNSTLPMTDSEILEMFGRRTGSNPDGSINYQLSSDFDDMEDLRNQIHLNKGGTVSTVESVFTTWLDNYNSLYGDQDEGQDPTNIGYTREDLIWDNNSGSNYTNKHIIFQEAYEFKIESYGDPRQLVQPNSNDLDLGATIFGSISSNTEFETCMNDLLDDPTKEYCEGQTHQEILEEIKNITNVVNLRPCHINYIEDKLKRISIVDKGDANDCMDILNLSESICEQPVSTKMLQIGYLVFHIVGLDKIDLEDIHEGSPQYYKLTNIIDRLTPYIRQSIKKIIDISKHYEEKTCGRESTTTHVLERMYLDLFEKSREVSYNINFMDLVPDYIIKDSNLEEFFRFVVFTILIMCGIYILLTVLKDKKST
jgi:hypothetical protein